MGTTTRGFEATLRAACYSCAPMVLGIIPLCGSYVYPVWQIVCRIFGYRGVHKTTGGKATAAVLLPIGLCCAAVILLYVAIFAAVLAGAPSSSK